MEAGTRVVLQKNLFLKYFGNINRKTPALESLFNKVLKNLFKIPTLAFSCEYCEIFKKTYFEKHLRMVASNISFPGVSFHEINLQREIIPREFSFVEF